MACRDNRRICPAMAYQWEHDDPIVFDDDLATSLYVVTRDGTVRSSDRWNQLQGAMESIHTFQPLKFIDKREAVRRGLIVLLSMVGIGAVATGYYLAMLRR